MYPFHLLVRHSGIAPSSSSLVYSLYSSLKPCDDVIVSVTAARPQIFSRRFPKKFRSAPSSLSLSALSLTLFLMKSASVWAVRCAG